jgi:hypothetical protein
VNNGEGRGGLLSTGVERGLLAMAFGPRYTANRQFYVFTQTFADDIVIVRSLRNLTDQNFADPAGTTHFTVAHPSFSNRNGGILTFGTNGCLYAGVGDGGGEGALNSNGQTIGMRLGKILRINPDRGRSMQSQ